MECFSVKVSIGLPFYNDEKTLKYTIQSILLQSYTDWELILLDDGSTDGSLAIAKSIKDNRIRVISDGENKGLAVRLNEIAKLAKGQFLARMDADDLMHPDRIEKQITFLSMHKSIDVVGTNAYSIDLNGNIIGKRFVQLIKNDIYEVLKKGLFIHPTIMGKTDWFRKNPYDESSSVYRAEDYELWSRTILNNCFATIDEPLLFYREASSVQKSIKNYMDTFYSMLRIQKKFFIELGYLKFIILQMSVVTRIILYWVLFKINYLDIIIKRRYKIINEGEKSEVIDILNKINRGAIY